MNNRYTFDMTYMCRVCRLFDVEILLYVNDLPNTATNPFSVLFADDTHMFPSSKDTNILVSNLNSTLFTVSDWLKANKLSISVKKTHYMVWYPRSFTMDKSLPIEFKGQQIEEVSETTLLGVVLDNGLTWKVHIQHVRNGVSRGAGILKKNCGHALIMTPL